MAYLGRSIDQPFYYGASDEIKKRAKALRKRMTSCEKILWQELRKNKLGKFYFRRQHPISRYIVDFYCHELRLVIEADGSIHNLKEHQERDKNRTFELENLGLKVIRYNNNEIAQNIRKVCRQIEEEVKRRSKETDIAWPHPGSRPA